MKHFREHGQAMTEFALILPVLLLMAVGIFEFGRAFYTYSAIANAAREGARYGILNSSDSTGIKNKAIEGATTLGLNASNITVQCISACAYDNQIRVTVTYSFVAVAPLIPSFTMNRTATMRILK